MLVLDRVGKTYPNGVRALDGISLDVAPGEILVVIGGSGCGKSTMLRAISGLDTPSQGKVVLRSRASCRGCASPTMSASAWSSIRRWNARPA
jgi:ABC-type Fe3+/spermidine/putrescine transport system ATPase subunit